MAPHNMVFPIALSLKGLTLMKTSLKCVFKDVRRDWQLYAFLLVPVLYIVIFAYVPMAGLTIAFRSYSARLGIWGSKWVGLENIIKFFTSQYFGRTVANTILLSAYSLVCSFPIPVIFALMINCLRSQRMKNVCQTIVMMPHFISIVVLVGMLFQFFNARTGLYGNIFYALFGSYQSDPFGNAENFRHFYIWSGVWQGFGWGSIIYVAALSAVDPNLHEAATIDGASRFQRVLHIDFPTILPTIVIMLILNTGSIMSIGFEKVYLMQNPLNLSTSEVISTYVYKVGLSSEGSVDFSYSTAIGLFNSIVNMIFIVVVNAIAGRVSENSLW